AMLEVDSKRTHYRTRVVEFIRQLGYAHSGLLADFEQIVESFSLILGGNLPVVEHLGGGIHLWTQLCSGDMGEFGFGPCQFLKRVSGFSGALMDEGHRIGDFLRSSGYCCEYCIERLLESVECFSGFSGADRDGAVGFIDIG